MKETLKDIGEKELLQRLRRYLSESSNAVRLFSEDCAVLEGNSGLYRLFTTDVMIENVHFRREYMDPYWIGRKAVLTNLSDLSAMGGTPSFFLLSAGFQEDLPTDFVERLYEGIQSVCKDTEILFAGGNLSKSEVIFLDIFMGGEVSQDEALFRNGGDKGDSIFVSSPLGASAAGLRCLNEGYRLDDEKSISSQSSQKKIINSASSAVKLHRPIHDAIKAHLEPPNHNVLARMFASWKLLSSMIDLSDGLAPDLREICRESGTGARVDLYRIPIAGSVNALADAMHWHPIELALYGGEDYHLLFTVPSHNKLELLSRLEAENITAYEIGELMESSFGIVGLNENGEAIPLKSGFQHF